MLFFPCTFSATKQEKQQSLRILDAEAGIVGERAAEDGGGEVREAAVDDLGEEAEQRRVVDLAVVVAAVVDDLGLYELYRTQQHGNGQYEGPSSHIQKQCV